VRVKVVVGIRVWVSVAGMGDTVSVGETRGDVETGSGESEAGAPPGLPRLQASAVRIKIKVKKYFEILMP
jgi:hypothetical protein